MREIMEKLCAPERDNGCSAASCRARGGKIGMLLRNDEREYERDKTDGELERGWEGGRKRGWRRREGEGKGPFSGRAGPIRLYRLIMQIVRLWDK